MNPLGLFFNPLGLFLLTSIPLIWRILSVFLPASIPLAEGTCCFQVRGGGGGHAPLRDLRSRALCLGGPLRHRFLRALAFDSFRALAEPRGRQAGVRQPSDACFLIRIHMNGVISRPDQTYNYEKIHAVRTRTLSYARRTGQERREEHHAVPKHQKLLKTIKNPWI